jgi:hypothetical protein
MAVKVAGKIRPSGALDDRLLRREAGIGRRVADSGGDLLLPVIDVAGADGRLLLVMPGVDGALAGQPLPAGGAAVDRGYDGHRGRASGAALDRHPPPGA